MKFERAAEIQYLNKTIYEIVIEVNGQKIPMGFTSRKSMDGIRDKLNASEKMQKILLEHAPENVTYKKVKGQLVLSNGAKIYFSGRTLREASQGNG